MAKPALVVNPISLDELSTEIRGLRAQQRLILDLLGSDRLPEDGALDKAAWVELLQAAGFSEADMWSWHQAFERRAPEKHLRFLQALCIPPDEIEMIRRYAAGAQPTVQCRQKDGSQMK